MKKLFAALSVFAIVNLLALGGAVGVAWQKGWLVKDRVRQAVSILRGEEAEMSATSESAGGAGGAAKANGSGGTMQQASEMIQQGREAEERMRIEFARREREIQDGFRLWEARQLALLREKEQLEADKKRFADTRAALAREAGDSGSKKEVETLSGIPAKDAKALLMAKEEAEAVRILKAMDQRKLNKIVKECKSEEERQWIGRILEKFTESDVAQAEVPGAG